MSRRIQVNQQTVNTHVAAISGHRSSFNARVSNVTGGTAPVIATADGLGISIGSFSNRYAAALPRSASDIRVIANAIAQVDATASDSMRTTR